MTPSLKNLMSASVTQTVQPSKNYKMYYEGLQVKGYADGISAMEQVIFKILNTERYRHIIYSWNYGIELEDLYGEPMSYVCAELERRIGEALCQDDRIDSVDTYTFDTSQRGRILVTFMVHTKYGDMVSEKEVSY